MKDARRIAFLSLLIAAVMLLAACGRSAYDLGDLLLDDAAPAEATAFTDGEKLNDMAGAAISSIHGDLVLLEKSMADGSAGTKYIVYHLGDGSVVWSETETSYLDFYITLYSLTVSDKTVPCFLVQQTYTDPENAAFTQDTTTLYSAKGERIAAADGRMDVEVIEDLIVFDGRCYRAAEDGSILYAFDRTSIGELPSIEEKYNGMYYELNEEYIAVYDDKLNFVSKYRLPKHLEDDIVGGCSAVLPDGNVFLQYIYETDPYSDDYTLYHDGEKLVVETEIIDAKSGSAKKIDCDYVFDDLGSLFETKKWGKDKGVDLEKLWVIGEAFTIEDRRLASYCGVSIGKGGDMTELGCINGNTIENISLWSQNRWIVYTEDDKYLVDETGRVIDNVTGAISYGKFLLKDGKLYDATLSVAYDCDENNCTVKTAVGDAVLLQDDDGRLLLCKGIGETVVLTEKDSREYYAGGGGYGFIALQNGETVELYDAQGRLVSIIFDVDSLLSVIESTDRTCLILLEGVTGETVYYRFR